MATFPSQDAAARSNVNGGIAFQASLQLPVCFTYATLRHLQDGKGKTGREETIVRSSARRTRDLSRVLQLLVQAEISQLPSLAVAPMEVPDWTASTPRLPLKKQGIRAKMRTTRTSTRTLLVLLPPSHYPRFPKRTMCTILDPFFALVKQLLHHLPP